ncbi:hypothetical protein NC651_028957 [Populus alba x Populus x berolinensis]|nr:hypothetical protein NC651_028957 [Populus alba x Populus x berolinensis]
MGGLRQREEVVHGRLGTMTWQLMKF